MTNLDGVALALALIPAVLFAVGFVMVWIANTLDDISKTLQQIRKEKP